MAPTLYVNPTIGSDSTGAGTQSVPFKSITHALKQAESGTQIQLAVGNYTAAGGEVFPLAIPSGVTVVGNEANKGSGISIEGSGTYSSRTFANQNVTFHLADQAVLRGVTVTNLASRGTAVWIESTDPTVANCTFIKSKREGVFVTGDANPVILGNVFTENAANGISIVRDAKGEIRGNTCLKTGFGLSIGDRATPLVVDNKISENRSGIVVSGDARPVLRNNLSERNTEDGLTVIANALPELGNSNQSGGNVIRYNGKFDLQNTSSNKLMAIGNQINPQKVKGSVELVNNQVPPPTETPTPTPSPTPTPTPTPIPSPDGLTDIADHWAAAFIQELVEQQIISGFPDRTFKPDASMTRAQYAALLAKAFTPPAKRPPTSFTDVPETFWGLNAIQQAYRGEFLSGFPDKTFRPNENVQRVQVIVSLVNGLKFTGGLPSNLSTYSDSGAIPDYAKDEVATATQKRLIVNHPQLKQLNPTRDATRAEVAAMIYQALVEAKAGSTD